MAKQIKAEGTAIKDRPYLKSFSSKTGEVLQFNLATGEMKLLDAQEYSEKTRFDESTYNDYIAPAGVVFDVIDAGVWPLKREDRATLARYISVRLLEHQASDGQPMRKRLGNLVQFISGRKWSIVKFNRRRLYTSDSPVSVVHNGIINDPKELAQVESILFPLNSELGLVMTARNFMDDAYIDNKALISGGYDNGVIGTTQAHQYLTDHLLYNAQGIVFCHPDEARYLMSIVPKV